MLMTRVGPDASRSLPLMFDGLFPPDGWARGIGAFVEAQLDNDLQWAANDFAEATARLNDEARGRVGQEFADLDSEGRSTVLASLFSESAPSCARSMLRVGMEGLYAAETPSLRENWRNIGFQPDAEESQRAPVSDGLISMSPRAMRPIYDTVVIGAGAGGGVLAGSLAEHGQSVLLLERGSRRADAELRGDHLHGKRLAVYAVNVGPGEGHPRVVEMPDGSSRTVDGNREPWEWALNAICVGGGTRLWQGMAWRFLPADFEMATRYGTPDDSSLMDWPIGYDDLEPYYDKAEWEIGVSGDDNLLTGRTPRRRGYPMPPLPSDATRRALTRAAERLGWGTGPIPFAINSTQRDGRGACVSCGQCMGHTCPVDAKNGSHNTALARAAATGNLHLLTSAQTLRIEQGRGSRPAQVTVGIEGPSGPAIVTVVAHRVVVCAGAIETPRLLLCSGLGNEQVGRNLHSHTIHLQLGLAAEPVSDFRGPGHSIASLDFAHDNDAPYGGGVVFDAPSMLPLAAASIAQLFGRPAWGSGHVEWMRAGRKHVIGTMALGQEIPHAGTNISVTPGVTDRWGQPVARIAVRNHSGSDEVRSFLADRCADWLDAAECTPGPIVLSGSALAEHAAGSCPMGEDPTTSACNRDGLLHGSNNIYVGDASLHPTNGGVNPALTVMANAYRIADAMLQDR
jgi:choline dehydrogenase-like flavoprotein